METLQENSLSIVVPAYNEETRFQYKLPHVQEYLNRNFNSYEIIYVDDGSTDGTFQALTAFAKTFPQMRVLRLEKNQGKGKAVRTGIENASGQIILFSDADFSTPIEDIQDLLTYIKKGFDIAIGSRGVTGSKIEIRQPLLRELTGKVGNAIVQTLLLLPFQDTQCGFKMFRADAIKTILPVLTIDGFAFDMEILAVAVARGFKIAEVPVVWRNVLESKVHLHHTIHVFWDLLKIRHDLSMGKYS
jgi:dolichyl-phosphate beta-glucosyltransferase